jgi:hypothetical protein
VEPGPTDHSSEARRAMRDDRTKKIPQLRARQRGFEKAAEVAKGKGDMRSWDHNTREAKNVRDEIVKIVKDAAHHDD